MKAYTLRRLLWAIPILFGAATIVFLLMHVLPGDIAVVILGAEGGKIDPVALAALREKLGLTLPLHEQYLNWLGGMIRGDFGTSLWTNQPVMSIIGQRLPYTASLVVLATVLSVVLAIPIGIVSALKQDKWPDYVLRCVVIAGISIPDFWLAALIVLFITQAFGWFPPIEYSTPWGQPMSFLQQVMLPVMVLGVRSATTSARMMRSAMLEVMREDFTRTGRAMGLTERTVTYVHALRNAILPVITMFGMQIAYLFGGTVIIETIFNIPGMGRLLMDAVTHRDAILVQGIVVFLALVIVVVNLLVDLLYAVLDPRIRYK